MALDPSRLNPRTCWRSALPHRYVLGQHRHGGTTRDRQTVGTMPSGSRRSAGGRSPAMSNPRGRAWCRSWLTGADRIQNRLVAPDDDPERPLPRATNRPCHRHPICDRRTVRPPLTVRSRRRSHPKTSRRRRWEKNGPQHLFNQVTSRSSDWLAPRVTTPTGFLVGKPAAVRRDVMNGEVTGLVSANAAGCVPSARLMT
jgi:hypothetical protein